MRLVPFPSWHGQAAPADAVVGFVDTVGGLVPVEAGQGAQSQVIMAATQGLLQLASRVPLVNHVASLLMDLGKLYQVRVRRLYSSVGSHWQRCLLCHWPTAGSGCSGSQRDLSGKRPSFQVIVRCY